EWGEDVRVDLEMSRVEQVAGLVGEVLRPVVVVDRVLHGECVAIRGVGDEDGELRRHPLAEDVELERDPLHHLTRRGPAPDGRDHPILGEVVVRRDQPVELGEVVVDRHGGRGLADGNRAKLTADLGHVLLLAAARVWSTVTSRVKRTHRLECCRRSGLGSVTEPRRRGAAMTSNCSLYPLKPLDPAIDPAYADGPAPPEHRVNHAGELEIDWPCSLI